MRWEAPRGHFYILLVSPEDADVGCNQLLSAKCISLSMLERLQKRLRNWSGCLGGARSASCKWSQVEPHSEVKTGYSEAGIGQKQTGLSEACLAMLARLTIGCHGGEQYRGAPETEHHMAD